MADIAFVALTLGFFALCAAYVRGLDRLVRGAEEADSIHDGIHPVDEVAA